MHVHKNGELDYKVARKIWRNRDKFNCFQKKKKQKKKTKKKTQKVN